MKWYEIKNKSDKAEIWIYDYIGKDMWTGEGVSAKDFQKELAGIKASQIDLHINSPGGDIFDGLAIYNLLKQHPANVTTFIDGWAASIASIIALAGDQVLMAENGQYMIHEPEGLVMGKSSDMRKLADVLDHVRDSSLTKTYMAKTGKTEAEINEMLTAETWMSAEQALDEGFIDEISDRMDMAACAKFIPVAVKMGFKNIPETIETKTAPTAKDAEKSLRDVGFSRKQSKKILAKGLSEGLRDADPEEIPVPAVVVQRDVEPPKPKKDRTADLLTRAATVAQQ